ncbi:uncharacterized protein TNCV_3991231 [Trichonephila clavipes]|uniref:CCHC-type domain-containing protein n=1 Tax=Trichonephila clavipes TaxID=2585209 RepID=A0A8X6VP43_TRICX|nr:uncharacterized protein TNCV_3991231 [Trichonephila clavipes]
MWFQHDGAPAYFSANGRNALDTAYSGQWLGWGGPDEALFARIAVVAGNIREMPGYLLMFNSPYVGSGEPKSVKRLRSGDLLIETNSALQTKSFLLAKSFLDCPVFVIPHKSLNSCRGVISEPDLLTTTDAEILDGFSDQGVIQVRRITIKKDTSIIPTKHVILTFNSPNLPTSIKAGYINCKIRPYIPNPLRCFKCQRFGHSQTACRGQLTCSRCASVGHASSDCTLEQKCVNCSQPHSADSKLCPKWKIEKEIQTIKTNRNISYIESRKFITPQPSQTYAQVAKSITLNSSSQTDETITKIVCPPLKLLQPLITISKPIMSPSVPAVIKSSTSTQAELVPSTSSVTVASPSKSPPPNSVIDTAPTTSNSLSISAASSSSTACSVLETTTTTSTVSTENLPVSVLNDSNNDHSNAAEAQQIVKTKIKK